MTFSSLGHSRVLFLSAIGWLTTISLFVYSSPIASTSKGFALYMLLLAVARLLLVVVLAFLVVSRTLDRSGYSLALRWKILLLTLMFPVVGVAVVISEFVIDELELLHWAGGFSEKFRWLLENIQMDIFTIILASLLAYPIALIAMKLTGWLRNGGNPASP